MAWSLLNHMIADKVKALLDEFKDQYPPDVERAISRENAEAAVHAILWAHASRSDATAAAYAASNLHQALGIKFCLFDQEEADACLAFYNKRIREKYAHEQDVNK